MCFLLLISVFLSTCGWIKKEPPVQRFTLTVASKTSRSDIITEAVIILNGYNFTIDYADSRRNQFALMTNWRTMMRQNAGDPNGPAIELRDRAILNLSPRAIQSNRSTMVASRLQFELQMWIQKTDKWVAIPPDETLREEYANIVNDIQNRLRKRGYIFD